MGAFRPQPTLQQILALTERQHGSVTHDQLLELGLTDKQIRHRLARRRLTSRHSRVYSLDPGTPSDLGRWKASELRCGPEAWLANESAGCLWGVWGHESRGVEIGLPPHIDRKPPRITVVRRKLQSWELTERHGIRVTTPAATLIDLAARTDEAGRERLIAKADANNVIRADTLLSVVERTPPRPGVGVLKETLKRPTFALTHSELERRFLPLALAAGLPLPKTQKQLGPSRVDFYWPELGLVVETDGLRYHRTPAQQTADAARDQARAKAGRTSLRFTHSQIRYGPDGVEDTLRHVATHIRSTAA